MDVPAGARYRPAVLGVWAVLAGVLVLAVLVGELPLIAWAAAPQAAVLAAVALLPVVALGAVAVSTELSAARRARCVLLGLATVGLMVVLQVLGIVVPVATGWWIAAAVVTASPLFAIPVLLVLPRRPVVRGGSRARH